MLKILNLLSLTLLLACQVAAQNWTTHCGNNERNGMSKLPGPQDIATPVWTINDATQTTLGMNIYSFGDLFVTSRVDFSPYHAIIECRDLTSGELVWTSADLGEESILYAMGFNEDAVYAHDYHSNLFYALNPSDGSVKWVSENLSYTFGPMDGVIYTCERDIIINGDLGSVEGSTICLDKETGEVAWTNANWFAVTPNETKAAHGNHLYLITGAINQPKKLAAVDIENGDNLYYSEELPGDGDQEGPIAVSPDGTIFFRRDGGDLYAVEDNGSGFNILWTYTPVSMGFLMNYGVDFKGNLLLLDNGKVYRLNALDGQPMDSSLVDDLEDGRITVGADSVIYVNNTDGAYYALSYDLQATIWSTTSLNNNYYAGPALSRNGYMVLCGAGTTIRAYKYEGQHAPVADFTASEYKVGMNVPIDFHDQSSFEPTEWYWEFPGADPAFSTDQHPLFITYQNPGIYDVSLTVSNGLGSDTLTKHCLIEVVEWIGMSGHLSSNDISCYPNPANDKVTFLSDYQASLNIIDFSGRVVFYDGTLKKERLIDVSQFAAGIYLVRLQGNNPSGLVKTEIAKLIVSR